MRVGRVTCETDLRDGMAFQGFVVSDWAAAHGYHAGLDVAMPGRVSTTRATLGAGTLLNGLTFG